MPQEAISNEPESSIAVRAQSSCFACGRDNLRGLQLQFNANKDGEMFAEWTPEEYLDGFEGIVHGGIVSTVLDESMAKAVAATGAQALTAELRVRFRRQVASGRISFIRGWIVSRNKRMIRTEAELTDSDGRELAHAWAAFLTTNAS